MGKELITPLNYLLAIIVGGIINLAQSNPLFVSPVPYIVPLFVQVFSKSAVKFQNRKKDKLIQLPEKRKDPGFLMDIQGNILECSDSTHKLFIENNIDNTIETLDDPVVNNDIYMRLAGLIFNYHYKTIVIMELKLFQK